MEGETSKIKKLASVERLNLNMSDPMNANLSSIFIYTHDLPVTVARKFVYADDLAIMQSAEDWQSLEGTLTQDMATLSSYLQKWKLKLSSLAYH